MKAKFHQFTPLELYGRISDPDTLEADSTIGFDITGGTFLDTFVGNLHQHGIRTALYHAALLGISRIELSFTIQALTGLSYTDFTTQYILLIATDLVKNKKKDLKDIAAQLGFGSYSGFYRFMLRNGSDMPSKI
jgi:hypothetical protein